MQQAIPPIFLPILQKENVSHKLQNMLTQNLSCNAFYLWPGFEAIPKDYWQPQQYPLTPKQAQICFNDFQSIGDAALSGVPMHALVTHQHPNHKLRDLSEQSLLTHFAKTGQAMQSDSDMNAEHSFHIQSAAQKYLLWAWLLEDHFREINALTQTYAHNNQKIIDTLGVDSDDALTTLEQIEKNIDMDNSAFLPAWEGVLENAVIFLPSPCTIIVNCNNMAKHVREVCTNLQDFNPQSNDIIKLNKDIKVQECHTTLKGVLNKSQKQQQLNPWLQKEIRIILMENI